MAPCPPVAAEGGEVARATKCPPLTPLSRAVGRSARTPELAVVIFNVLGARRPSRPPHRARRSSRRREEGTAEGRLSRRAGMPASARRGDAASAPRGRRRAALLSAAAPNPSEQVSGKGSGARRSSSGQRWSSQQRVWLGSSYSGGSGSNDDDGGGWGMTPTTLPASPLPRRSPPSSARSLASSPPSSLPAPLVLRLDHRRRGLTLLSSRCCRPAPRRPASPRWTPAPTSPPSPPPRRAPPFAPTAGLPPRAAAHRIPSPALASPPWRAGVRGAACCWPTKREKERWRKRERMGVFNFFPAITRHLFRGRLQKAHALRRRKEELFVPLINSRREYKKNGGEPKKETTTFTHSYVDNLLDINLPEDGNRALTDDELVMLCSEFLVAGTDSTSAALQWIMAELVRNPSIQSKLYEEIKSKTGGGGQHEVSEEDVHDMPYLKAVVLEGLRKHPPAHMLLPHKAAEDMDVGGYLIPKGTIVNFMVAEMGRDEKEWEKPMEFMPERFLPGGDGEGVDVTSSKGIRMMPFGVGRRICPGLGIAMLHLEYFVANMVREFEWKEVAGDEVDFAEKREFNTVMAKPLRVRLVPRSTLE
ncbi:Os10g0515400 [Oryza sativa Japonica Group]|uniref:Os10g0515400 protein n=1 Tax=Oryza sativa subsp. japonica TaxID=39947 RepID=A0A0P0XW95_ORYSJ|nr:Os10g0515400 [Oryza sativa Japonica Group]